MKTETLRMLETIARDVLIELNEESHRHVQALDTISNKADKLQSHLSMILAIQEQQEAKP